jgi:hypothetical protein
MCRQGARNPIRSTQALPVGDVAQLTRQACLESQRSELDATRERLLPMQLDDSWVEANEQFNPEPQESFYNGSISAFSQRSRIPSAYRYSIILFGAFYTAQITQALLEFLNARGESGIGPQNPLSARLKNDGRTRIDHELALVSTIQGKQTHGCRLRVDGYLQQSCHRSSQGSSGTSVPTASALEGGMVAPFW